MFLIHPSKATASKQLKQKVSCTVILPLMNYRTILWWFCKLLNNLGLPLASLNWHVLQKYIHLVSTERVKEIT